MSRAANSSNPKTLRADNATILDRRGHCQTDDKAQELNSDAHKTNDEISVADEAEASNASSKLLFSHCDQAGNSINQLNGTEEQRNGTDDRNALYS
jgi:hypothetical protein